MMMEHHLRDNFSPRKMYLGVREIPEIDGSQGAFIGVVVALSVLILGCCAAVYYLLLHHEPTDQDRAARRERYRRAREQTLNASSTTLGPSTFGSSGGGASLSDKMRQVWQSTTGMGGRRGGRGWVRAGSDDAWAPHPEPLSNRASEAADPDPERGGDGRPGLGGGGGSSSEDTVRIVESPLSDSASGFGARGYVPYVDPYSKTTEEVVLQRAQSPIMSYSPPMSSPRESASGDESPTPPPPADERRHRLTLSNGSVWTQAGSKFIEDI